MEDRWFRRSASASSCFGELPFRRSAGQETRLRALALLSSFDSHLLLPRPCAPFGFGESCPLVRLCSRNTGAATDFLFCTSSPFGNGFSSLNLLPENPPRFPVAAVDNTPFCPSFQLRATPTKPNVLAETDMG